MLPGHSTCSISNLMVFCASYKFDFFVCAYVLLFYKNRISFPRFYDSLIGCSSIKKISCAESIKKMIAVSFS